MKCPVCGIEGTLDIVDGEIKWNSLKNSRIVPDCATAENGVALQWIRDGAMTQKKVENLKELKLKYIGVGEK